MPKPAIAEMYIHGVSLRKVTEVMRHLCGLHVSSAQVSRATQLLDEKLTAWRQRPLGTLRSLIPDARYEKIRHGGSVASCAVLIAVGTTPEGRRSLPGVGVSLSEPEVYWRGLIASPQDRGMHGIILAIRDDHAGLKAVREARLPGVTWHQCQSHLQQNAGHYVPRIEMRRRIASDLRAIFNAPDRAEADPDFASQEVEIISVRGVTFRSFAEPASKSYDAL